MTNQVREEVLTRNLSTFSGSDVIGVLNGHVLGEAFSIKYKEVFISPPEDGFHRVTGKISALVFDRSPIKPYMNRKGPDEFIVFLLNENGRYLSIRFEGFCFTERTGSFDVDDLVMEETFHFACEEIVFDNETPFGSLGVEHDFKFGYTEKVVEAA
ncbi:hypothetical protein [Bacillus cereus group sp. Bce040]|uniref:hypothetical protein n=1 Tax=Bacillus cereus group sp. Bce040 TaxID=3445229 RepID=UPI003F235DC6